MGCWGRKPYNHKTVYDLKSLTVLLNQVGFEQVRKWDWKNVFTNHEDFDDHSQAYYPIWIKKWITNKFKY